MAKICSLSLWGSGFEYWSGALQNARLHQDLGSGYDVFVFTDISSLNQASCDPRIRVIINELERSTVLIKLDRTPGYMGMFWRMLPFLWNGVERVIVRDADSILTNRELHAIRQWENSKFPFHIMRIIQHIHLCDGWNVWRNCKHKDEKYIQTLRHPFQGGSAAKFNTGCVDQVFLKRYIFPCK